jgi:transposase
MRLFSNPSSSDYRSEPEDLVDLLSARVHVRLLRGTADAHNPSTRVVCRFQCSVDAAAMPNSGNAGPASSTSQSMAKDTLPLSKSQQSVAWKNISAQAAGESAPAGFNAQVGAAVPSSLATHLMSVSTANKVPALHP